MPTLKKQVAWNTQSGPSYFILLWTAMSFSAVVQNISYQEGSFLNGNPLYWHSFQLFAESCTILLSDHRKSISFQSCTLDVMSLVDERILSVVRFKDGMYNNVCC